MKRHTLLILGVVLAFVLAACGDDGGTATPPMAQQRPLPGRRVPDLDGRTVTDRRSKTTISPSTTYRKGETEGLRAGTTTPGTTSARCSTASPEFVEIGMAGPMIDQVAAGEFDVAADGISITDERKEIVDFSDPYMVVEQKFVVQLADDRYDIAQALIDDTEAIVATQIGYHQLRVGGRVGRRATDPGLRTIRLGHPGPDRRRRRCGDHRRLRRSRLRRCERRVDSRPSTMGCSPIHWVSSSPRARSWSTR